MYPNLKQYLLDSQADLLQLIRALCAIPAPSHAEQHRAEFCKVWFEKAGGKGVYIDEALNVICPYHVTEDAPVVVVMAHTDTVFPDTDPMPYREDDNNIYCPGVCDDTANLAVLMICARYFLQNNIPAKQGILFVANSCEEGLGNLKGCRAIADAYGSRMTELITFDGTNLHSIVDRAVGSHRYRITVKTEGGHSFNAFGNRNAIRYLASIIDTLYTVKVPEENGSKTTYNVGTISGGTSVNTIAQEAEMLYEYRSDNKACLAQMEATFLGIVEDYRASGLDIDVRRIGERPCAGDVDEKSQQALRDRAAEAIRAVTGKEPVFCSGSTDCNIPLSLGIPAICIGVCIGQGAHTREESLEKASLLPGCRLAMTFLKHYFL